MSLTRRILTVLAAAFAGLVSVAGPASAHAELVASTPSQGSVVGTEPAQVTLRFSEEIVPRLSAIKVIGPDGRRLDTGTPHAGPTGEDSLAADLAPDARHGTFVVVWQVTAADDGHASSGTVMFAVGAASAPANVAGLGRNHLTSAVYDTGQWLGFAGLALVGGVAAARTYRRRGEGIAASPQHAPQLTMTDHTDQPLEKPATSPKPATPATPPATTKHTALRLAATDHADQPLDTMSGSGHEVPAPPSAAATASHIDQPPEATTTDSGAEPTAPPAATPLPAAGRHPATIAPEAPPPTRPSLPRAIPTWPAALGWSLLLIGTLVQVTAYAPAARGLPLSHLLDRSLLSVTLATREGHAFMARLVVLAVAAVVGDAVLRRATNPGLPLAFTLAVAATWGATGHAATGGGAGVAMVALTLHVAAMAVWVGGLFVVAVLAAGGGGAVAATVRRFSRLALGAVGVLVATGLYQGWREVGSVSALMDTAYGRLLLAKVAVLLCVIGVAGRSRGIVATWRAGSEASLRRAVLLELAGASVLLLLAVLLAGNAPAR